MSDQEKYEKVLRNYLKKYIWQFEFQVSPELRVMYVQTDIDKSMLMLIAKKLGQELLTYFNLMAFFYHSKERYDQQVATMIVEEGLRKMGRSLEEWKR
jgi:hypothetical protein